MFIPNKITKRLSIFLLPFAALLTASCAVGYYGNQSGWTTTNCADAGWATIPISEKIDYNLLYDDVVSLVSRRFEIEMLTKESGYIRTKWDNKFATNGVTNENYRTRVTLKLSQARKIIEVKSEAEKMMNGNWVSGCDTKVLETMKQDLRGMSGY